MQRAEQAAAGAATLQHFDDVLGKMAAQDKGVVMSMNPVTDTSFPINSSQGDAMLLKHRVDAHTSARRGCSSGGIDRWLNSAISKA